jgi:hypothetical protein
LAGRIDHAPARAEHLPDPDGYYAEARPRGADPAGHGRTKTHMSALQVVVLAFVVPYYGRLVGMIACA